MPTSSPDLHARACRRQNNTAPQSSRRPASTYDGQGPQRAPLARGHGPATGWRSYQPICPPGSARASAPEPAHSGGSRVLTSRSVLPVLVPWPGSGPAEMYRFGSGLPGSSGDVGGDDVSGMAVQRSAGPVIAHRGARISAGSGFLDIAERDPSVQRGRDEHMPQGVRSNGLGDPGAAGDAPDDPPGAVAIEPPIRSGLVTGSSPGTVVRFYARGWQARSPQLPHQVRDQAHAARMPSRLSCAATRRAAGGAPPGPERRLH